MNHQWITVHPDPNVYPYPIAGLLNENIKPERVTFDGDVSAIVMNGVMTLTLPSGEGVSVEALSAVYDAKANITHANLIPGALAPKPKVTPSLLRRVLSKLGL